MFPGARQRAHVQARAAPFVLVRVFLVCARVCTEVPVQVNAHVHEHDWHVLVLVSLFCESSCVTS